MHATDSNLFFDQGTTTGFLARSRAGQTQDIGKGQYLFNQASGLFHRALSDQFQVAGDIDVGRTIDLTGRLTIRIVIGKHHL